MRWQLGFGSNRCCRRRHLRRSHASSHRSVGHGVDPNLNSSIGLRAEALAPHLTDRHTVVLMPGTLGSLEWAELLRKRGVTGVTLAEVDTAPYVCRKTAPDEATIWGLVTGLGLGVLMKLAPKRPSPGNDSMPRCGASMVRKARWLVVPSEDPYLYQVRG